MSVPADRPKVLSILARAGCEKYASAEADLTRLFERQFPGFLMLPPGELAELGTLVSVRDPHRFFSGNPGDPFRPEAPVWIARRRLAEDALKSAR